MKNTMRRRYYTSHGFTWLPSMNNLLCFFGLTFSLQGSNLIENGEKTMRFETERATAKKASAAKTCDKQHDMLPWQRPIRSWGHSYVLASFPIALALLQSPFRRNAVTVRWLLVMKRDLQTFFKLMLKMVIINNISTLVYLFPSISGTMFRPSTAKALVASASIGHGRVRAATCIMPQRQRECTPKNR